ncbi:MAG: hypothetical protein AAGH79_03605 [Bacteroidota bacterium]
MNLSKLLVLLVVVLINVVPCIGQGDSLYLSKFLRSVENDYLDEDEHSTSAEERERLLYEQGILILGGSLVYAPDSTFVIYQVLGESCGAYCNPFWESKVQPKEGSTVDLPFLSTVDSILLLPDSSYLVLQSGSGRPASVFSITTQSASILSWHSGVLQFQSFHYPDPRWGTQEGNSNPLLSFSQEHFLETEQYLFYEARDQTLRYQYAYDLSYCCGEDASFVVKGHFQYVDGEMVWVAETHQPILKDD